MNNLVKSTISGTHRVHAPTGDFKPVCGGGNGARSANWQEDIGAVTCLRCITILKKRATPPPEKNSEPATELTYDI
jgi:hypothetical protein